MSRSKSSPNPPVSIQGYEPEPPRVQPGLQPQPQSQPDAQPRLTMLPPGQYTHILPFYPGYHPHPVPLSTTGPASWSYSPGTYAAPPTASSTGWIVPPAQNQFTAVPLPYHPYSYHYNHHYYHPAAPLHLLPTTSTPTYNLPIGSMATRTRMFHPTSSTRQTATDTPTPPPVYTELTGVGPGCGYGHEGYTRMAGRVGANASGTRVEDRSRSRSRERERGRERSRSPVRDRLGQAQQLRERQKQRQHLQQPIAALHTKLQAEFTSRSTGLPSSPHVPSSVLEPETETESVSISLSSSQSQPRIPRKINLVPQSWLMGRSVSASGSDVLLSAGPTGKESGDPTGRNMITEGSEVVSRDGEARRSLKRDWSPRPRSVGSRHQPIPSPYTAGFPVIPLHPGPSGWENMDMDVDVGSEEVESSSESEQTDDSEGTSGNEEETVQASKGIPLAVYRQSHSRSQVRDQHHQQQHHHTRDVHRPTSTGGSKGPEPVSYEVSDGVGGSMSWTQAGSEPESELETASPPTSLVGLPVSYRDIPNPPYIAPRSTKARTSKKDNMKGLSNLSSIDPRLRRPTAYQGKRKRPSASGRSAGLEALDPDEGVVHMTSHQEAGNDRVTSFEACFGDMSDLTDLDEDNAINGEAVTTFYMASRAGDDKDSSRRPTRYAARQASARIQAIASPDRTSDSASDMAKNTWNQTLHVDVEDERSDESQRSMGTRKIKRRARRTVTLPDPAPDQTVHKVARGRTAAHHPSLVQSSIVHVCPIPGCGACFKRREHVKRHVRGIHTLEKPYHCLHNGCGKSFARRDNLGLHYTKVHKMSNRKCLQLLASGDKEV